ncbi:MAG TPA: histidine phosphatase family protein [Gammaproteobacteria bacterium]|nr:histidine phosphatase family protein [Gammaproteobacteria bacterium]
MKNRHNKSDQELKHELSKLGIDLDIISGHLFYSPEFKPLTLDFDLVFVRHGETFGNCGQSTSNGEIDQVLVMGNIKDSEKRIYQGNVDENINQLTEYGKQQARDTAEKLKHHYSQNNSEPDIILMSPLTRAIDTATPYIINNNFHHRSYIYDDIREMSFGSWDNRRVCDLHSDNRCHLFYLDQHALVKDTTIPGAESFCDVILRAHKALTDLNDYYLNKRILMFSHSMLGAACCILLGKGQIIENGNHLAFDGKRKDGSYYTMPNATPFSLTAQTTPTAPGYKP